MKVVFYDGGILTCSKIWIYGDKLICDDIWEVPIIEVNGIDGEVEENE